MDDISLGSVRVRLCDPAPIQRFAYDSSVSSPLISNKRREGSPLHLRTLLKIGPKLVAALLLL